MMCDTNWCTYCDNAINPYSNSLYCSEYCLRQDALTHHPLLGYDYAELEGFPHHQNHKHSSVTTISYARRKSSIPTLLNTNAISTNTYALPSLSSSISSATSFDDTRRQQRSYVDAQQPTPSYQPMSLANRLDNALLGSS